MPPKVHSSPVPVPTVAEIEAARRTFVEQEPRDLFYRVATELIDLSLRQLTKISLAEALAVLLQTWNKAYYQYRRFDQDHLRQIEELVDRHGSLLGNLRSRSILTFEDSEGDRVRVLFAHFAEVLGPVGAAKCLHLLAPSFFPLWDRAIAKAHGLKLDGCAQDDYVRFIRIVKQQCTVLTTSGAEWPDLLKAIDEYNYCKYTLKVEPTSAV